MKKLLLLLASAAAFCACPSSSSDTDGGTTQFPLTVTLDGQGTGTVSSSPAGINCGADCTERFDSTKTVTLTATPASNSLFSGWGGACTGTGACSVKMSSARSVTATFAESVTYTLTVTVAGAGSGTVASSPAGISCASGSCNGAFAGGTAVTLTATPAASGNFTGWNGAGCSGTGACVVALTADTTVTATFGGSSLPNEIAGTVAAMKLQGAALSWTNPTAAGFTKATVYARVHGTTPWGTAKGSTASANEHAFTVTGLTPGRVYDFKVTATVSAMESAGDTSAANQTTAFSGTTGDFLAAQTVTGLNGQKFRFTWSDTDLYVGLSKGDDSSAMVDGDAVWVGVDTDPLTDATGSFKTLSSGSNDVIWPFNADRVVALKLAGTAVSSTFLDPATGVAATGLTGSTTFNGALAEVSFSKASLGGAAAVRFALAHLAGASGQVYDLAPANSGATDVYGFFASITSSFVPGVNLWDATKTATSGTVTTKADAAALVTISEDRTAAPTGAMKVYASVHPFDFADGTNNFSLKLVTGGHVYSGKFNLGGATGPMYFAFVDGTSREDKFANNSHVYTLSGVSEVIPTLTWDVAYSATHTFSVTFAVTDVMNKPTNVNGNIAELGIYSQTPGDALTGSASPYLLTLTFTNGHAPDFSGVSGMEQSGPMSGTDLQFKATYAGSNVYETGNNHSMPDDVVNKLTIAWTATHP